MRIFTKKRKPTLLPLFEPGRIVITPGADEALKTAMENPTRFLGCHMFGDWGDLDQEYKEVNDHAVEFGHRILSAYTLRSGVRLWILTEPDRSVTTLLLPLDTRAGL